jgi:hypothetical protein
MKKVLFCLLCVVCFLTSCGKPNSAAKKAITTNDNLVPSPANSTKPNASESSKVNEPKEELADKKTGQVSKDEDRSSNSTSYKASSSSPVQSSEDEASSYYYSYSSLSLSDDEE